MQNISKVRRKALKSAETKLYELVFASKMPIPTFVKQVKADFFQQCALEREATRIESSLGVYQKHPNKAGYC